MSDKIFTQSQLPIRRSVDLLPEVFKTETNSKFMAGVVDPLIQPGVLQKTVGYIGRRYGKTYKSNDVYLDTDETLRSAYQLEPGVVLRKDGEVSNFYDYVDFKNQLRFFGNNSERDDLLTEQDHYTWNPPIEWDKFVNYREYYWVPSGPPSVKVFGRAQGITSTYRVRLGSEGVWILTPDGLTNNPTITLYRGLTYNFNVNSPRNSFYIRTSVDQGSSTNYTKGIKNAGTTNGKVIFEVPFEAPDVLYYQSNEEPERCGRILIKNIEEDSKLDISKEILGKETYKSSNGVEFTNGLIVEFVGQTLPKMYSSNRWVVEGVGQGIRLINFDTLRVPAINTTLPEVLFDNAGFDAEPYDDATTYPAAKDYITINRASMDFNPWSRYNRWFHKSTLEYAHSLNGTVLDVSEDSRAKRPIIEYSADLQLFNHGAKAKVEVDYIDTFTNDVFSTIEGSTGYNVDGEFLFEGARILVTADTDSWANNRIYKVTFISHNGRRQISLIETEDSASLAGECVLINRGKLNSGLMYHFDGSSWKLSQRKTATNQFPKFDAFNENGVSFGDLETYPVSTFAGTEIVSYKVSTAGVTDSELGFKLSYLNIDNVGDIQFEFDWDKDTFNWQKDQTVETVSINSGFYRINNSLTSNRFENGWIKSRAEFLQPIIDAVTVSKVTNTITSTACDWKDTNREKIVIYLNGNLYLGKYTRPKLNTFVFEKEFSVGDVITLKIYTDQTPDTGYYQIPFGLERNPLNSNLETFTLGQAGDHAGSMVELVDDFVGAFPGSSNLRDLSNYQQNGRRFLKHSSPIAHVIALLCSKDLNLIRSIQYAKKSYTEFKNSFLTKAADLFDNQLPCDFVDEILADMTKAKVLTDAFGDSDMLGFGAHTKIEYEVEDEDIKTFALSEKFDLNTLSRKAVYVYLNDVQLLAGKDYSFNSNFGFITLTVTLAPGDRIVIREYTSTSFSYIPATPTSMGLYKKYTPMMYVDDTFQIPTKVIQGHDGSITVAFNDVRDDVLLELEKRIYNNIKREYDPSILDIASVFGGYYGNAIYTKDELTSIIDTEFLKWVSNTDVDYITNNFFDDQNSFTYTYSKMTDPTKTMSLPGFWRGVYRWFYDTDRPHTHPWEMLHFSEKPDWWEAEYGKAPYTSGNLILWEDLANGIVRQGPSAGEYDRFKRSTLLSHIPVDADGKLLSPLDSGLAQEFSLIRNNGDFKFGDVAPVEAAWQRSSEFPYAIMIALALLRPFDAITKFLDPSRLTKNIIGQIVNSSTKKFNTIQDIVIPQVGVTQTCGFINWIVDYAKGRNQSVDILTETLNSIDVNIANKIGGFVDQSQQKYLLDSKNPKSTSSNVFIPNENYSIFFNVSVPISSVVYSGVVIEKRSSGWRITGYDSADPVFKYYKAIPSQIDPLIEVGGVSEPFVDWTSEKFYNNGQIVRNDNAYYRTTKSHTSGSLFETANFQRLARLPQVGAVEALKRRTFNTLEISELTYGTVLSTIQEVVDFILGYEQYLISLGFVFDQFDKETQVNRDWFTSAKEFMFWTKHNWAEGSLLTLSPSADKVDINIPIGVPDNLFDTFYDYQIYKSDGTPLLPNYINVNRDIQRVTVSTTNTADGIYFIKINYVLKEHVVLFSDRTVFNDVIYDKITGYRQDRIKVRGFRTTDWDGDYTSPGFLFDNVNIQTWQPFTDYKLGDIVAYREYYWTSLENQVGTLEFDNSKWSKLDLIPTKGLVPNFDYRINQFDDYYNLDADGVGSSQRDLGRHSIGYQVRDYLQNIAEDQVTQFNLYQGFIREKGTKNSIVKIFDKLSRADSDSLTLYEEWAFRVGRFGGTDQYSEYEISVNKPDFKINPQPILVVNSVGTTETDRYIRVSKPNFTVVPQDFTTHLNPLVDYPLPGRSAGYVKTDQVNFVVKSRDNLLELDITAFKENDNVWVTFDESDWTVLRYNVSKLLITPNSDGDAVVKNQDKVTVYLNTGHQVKVGDIVGIKGIVNLSGFFKVSAIDRFSITVTVSADAKDPEFDTKQQIYIGLFSEARIKDYASLDVSQAALLRNGSKLWIDNGDKGWEVVQKTNQYSLLTVNDLGLSNPVGAGTAVLYVDSLKQIISSIPGSNYVVTYNAARPQLTPTQFISISADLQPSVDKVFGTSIAVSPDSRWMIVGSPLASSVATRFKGTYNPAATYEANDIVRYNNTLWSANKVIVGDGSTIDISVQDWRPTTLVMPDVTGDNDGYYQQGLVTIYEWGSVSTTGVVWDTTTAYVKGQIVTYTNRQYVALQDVPANTVPDANSAYWIISSGRWNEKISIVSPGQAANEHFGYKVSISVTGNTYYLAVSAPGANNGTGKVYLYTYDTAQGWKHLTESGFAGTFSNSQRYPLNSIVWWNNALWKALIDIQVGAADPVAGSSWELLEDVSVQSFLPTPQSNVSDGPDLGLLDNSDLSEMVKSGDGFGGSVAMSDNGNLLVVGAPTSDGQYYENYRGEWKSNQTYYEGDVVKKSGTYYKLVEQPASDVVITSYNEDPSTNPVWDELAPVSSVVSGKVFVYKRNAVGNYKLVQTLTSKSLETDTLIASGDQFGYAVSLDSTGTTLVVSSPFADFNYQNQGSVYVFTLNSTNGLYSFVQKLESYETTNNENFGNSIAISSTGQQIVVGAQNSSYRDTTTFDVYSEKKTGFYVLDKNGNTVYTTWVNDPTSKENTNLTTFDADKVRFFSDKGSTGQVYVFEKKGPKFILAEKLDVELTPAESFGYSVDCDGTGIVAGSPNFISNGSRTGKVTFFNKTSRIDSWKIITQQSPLVNIDYLKGLSVYDPVNNVKIADVDIVDHFKLKILGIAEQEIKFKTPYDPAVYSIGTADQVVDASQSWLEKNVGAIWWNVSKAKWTWYEQGDVAYRTGNWNNLAVGSEIEICEWVESVLLPSEWSVLADTADGIAEGISGQPLYPDDTVYSIKEQYNSVTGELIGTKYYYWVKNKTTIPSVPGRRKSAAEVATLISNPVGSGQPIIALIDSDKFIAYNLDSIIPGDTALINIQYVKTLRNLNQIHLEYQLLSEGNPNSIIPQSLETKWIDSLIGFDSAGNQVPDPNLSAKQKYGIEFRPRQSMFVDRSRALRIVIDRVNETLSSRPFTEFLDFGRLNEIDPAPAAVLNLYDQTVETFNDLETVGTARVKQAILRANVIDGKIDTIDIVDPGFGYKVAPPVDIQGAGIGAKAVTTIDNQGRVNSVTVELPGKNYSASTILRVRSFSVLVQSDVTSNNFWSIYSWDQKSKVFYRSKTQEFNTQNYWYYTDWWADGYSSSSRVVSEINGLYLENTISVSNGDLIRVKEYGDGGWIVLERTATGGEILNKYNIVGRQNGTIKLKESLYNLEINNVGYDNVGTYDSIAYDQQPIRELRNIFAAIKHDILVDDLAIEWNNLFFASIGYVFSEQLYVDWAFKTSFMTAVHKIGDLAQKTNYKNDNLDSFRMYIDEVKPYRTKVREYTSQYTEYQPYPSNVTDFDNPPAYSEIDGKIVPVKLGSFETTTYPWNQWAENLGYSVKEIKVYNAGSGYTTPPTVIISSDSGTGAKAQAYIANGKVSGIKVTAEGSGYLSAPTITLVGGNGQNAPAKATAVIGNGAVRGFNIAMKFDRISKEGILSDLVHEETFNATGYTSVFELSYAPTRDKNKITVFKNGELILSSQYQIDLYISSVDTYSLLKGKLKFNTAPVAGDKISVVYEINDLLLDATNRIEKFYNPVPGMLGFSQETLTMEVVKAVVDSQIIELTSARNIIDGMRVSGTGVEPCRVLKVVSSSHVVLSVPQTIPAGTVLSFVYNNPNQLMTGIDFGGVQVQGNLFDITGGWDALPWFTDAWDSVEKGQDYYHVVDGSTTVITLPEAPADGEELSIYLKREQDAQAVRIDDRYFGQYDGSTVQPNGKTEPLPTAVMRTFIGDGTNRDVVFPASMGLVPGDIVIFRPFDSDGTVNVTDKNLIDTLLTGGTLESMRGAYSTATGRTAEEIIVEGEKFISPDQVPATEENIPGQVLESVSIKVFHSKKTGAPSLMSRIVATQGNLAVFDIGQTIFSYSNVFVYVDKVKQTDSYIIDFVENKVQFKTPVAAGSVVEIISVGLGGIEILDYQEFVADGETRLFLTNADYIDTASVVTTVDGDEINSAFTNSTGVVDTKNKTLVDIPIIPEAGQSVKIVVLGAALNTDTNQEPLVRVNQQSFVVDQSTRAYTVDGFVDLNRSSARGSILVELNGRYLKSSDSQYRIYDGTNNVFNLAEDPFYTPGTVSISDINVYKNDQLLGYITDWTFNGTNNKLTLLASRLTVGDKIRVEQNVDTEYNIVNGQLILDNSVAIDDSDTLTITWFSEYPSVELVKEVFNGGKRYYKLSRKPISISYVWVYKNGERLTQGIDYVLTMNSDSINILGTTLQTDNIEIVQFGANTYSDPVAYEIFKDMLNVHRFNRFSINEVELAQDLNYFDQTIVVTDATKLSSPIKGSKLPGVVSINGERIEYFEKTGNILKQLRRGSLGTPIAEIHKVGSKVVDVGFDEVIPYSEEQEKYDYVSTGALTFVSDGSTRTFDLPSIEKFGDGNSSNLMVSVNDALITDYTLTPYQNGAGGTITIGSSVTLTENSRISVISLLVGPLPFNPAKSAREFYRVSVPVKDELGNITETLYPSIPADFGPCDQIEVFVGGRRLHKNSRTVYDQSLAASSPAGDVEVEADFSVTTGKNYIRLTEMVPAGIRITILRRIGKTWYENGTNTPSKGLTMLDNNTVIMNFIQQKTSKLP